jgi:carboxyl-terminal processing protease
MKRLATTLLTALVLAVLMGGAAQDAYQTELRKSLNRFGEVYRNVSNRYVDRVNPDAAIEAAIHGLMEELDPYSDYFIEESAQDLEDMSRGQYGGIGMEVGLRGSDKRVTVISPFEGTPSWDAGLLAGDEIIGVDSVDVRGWKLQDVVGKIKGKPGTDLLLRIARGKEEAEYRLTRQLITIHDVRFAGIVDEEAGIGYIRLTRFSGKAGENMFEAVSTLKQAGMQKLVLDLRGNPGGMLREAVAICDLFLDPDLDVVVTRVRDDEVKQRWTTTERALFKGEMIVLVNGGSASASEIVAGVLQDYDRAVVLGEPSFGKGLVQSVIDIDQEAKVKLTTGRYYLPSGRLIQKVDYFKDNEVLNHLDDAVARDTLFHTTNGREVLAGRGIKPDMEVKAERSSWLVSELWREGMFINFISDHFPADGPADATISRRDLKDFAQYAKDEGFEYQPRGSSALDELRTILEEEKSDKLLKDLEDLREDMAQDLDQQFEVHADEISHRLQLELSNLRSGSDARTRLALTRDPAFAKASELLAKDGQDEYTSMLGPITAELN